MAIQIITFTVSNSAWAWSSIPATVITAHAIGAGGGGGAARGNPSSGGGGKGGGYARAVITKGAETTLNVVVATQANGTSGAGNPGPASSVLQGGITRVLAQGGSGGAQGSSNSTNGAGATTMAGTAAIGTVTYAGGNGGTGSFAPGALSGAGGGAAGPNGPGGNASGGTAGTAGGGLNSGPGAAGVGDNTNGGPPLTGYGGGACGGKANQAADSFGGNSYPGIVWFEYDDTPPAAQDVTAGTVASASVARQPTVAYAIKLDIIRGVHNFGTPGETTSASSFGEIWSDAFGQRMVLSKQTRINRVAVRLLRSGTHTGGLEVRIVSGTIDGPTVATTAVLPSASVSGIGAVYNLSFTPTVVLAAGTYYWQIWAVGGTPNEEDYYGLGGWFDAPFLDSWYHDLVGGWVPVAQAIGGGWFAANVTVYSDSPFIPSVLNTTQIVGAAFIATTLEGPFPPTVASAGTPQAVTTSTIGSTATVSGPIVEITRVLMSARLNVGRLNAFRLNYAPPVTVDQDVSLPLIGGAVALPPLEGYWAFDEAVGTTAGDSTGHGHSINLIAAAWDTANNIFGASAVKWDGTGARIGDFAAPLSIGTVHTVACWINDWDGSTDGIIVNAQSATAAYALYLDGTNIYYSAGAGNFVSVAHGGGLAGSPHHLVVTRNGSSVTFYIDGVSKGTQTLSSGGDAIDLISIGGRFVAAFIWHGTIDDLRVYLTALTPGEVAALYALDPGAAVGGAQVFAPSTAVGPVSATLPHIAASSTIAEPLVTVDAVSITLPSIASTSTIYAPSTAAVGFVTTPTLGSTATLTAPTVTTLTQVTGAFIGSTVAVRAPGVAALSFVTTPFISSTVSLYSLQVTQNVLLAFCPSTAVLYPPSSQIGPVSITLGYIASTTVLHGMIVSTGAIAIITATFGPGSTVFPPLATTGPVTVTLPTVTSTAQARPPAVAPGAVVVTAGFLASTATLNPPAIGAGTITLTLPVITSTVQVYPPSSDVGQVGVTTAFLASTATVFPPIILIGAAVVVPGFITSTSTVFALSAAYAVTVPMVGAASSASSPSVAYAVLLPACAPTSIVFPPALAVGAATVELPLIGSTTNVYPLGAAYEVTPPAIINVSDLYAPDVAVEVVIVSIPSGVQLFPPFTGTESFATTAFIDGETVAYAPFRVQALNILQPAPPERHFMVPFEYRMFNVGFVERGFIVPFDRRMYDVGFEQREFIVPFEYRHWEEEYAVPVRHGGKGSRR